MLQRTQQQHLESSEQCRILDGSLAPLLAVAGVVLVVGLASAVAVVVEEEDYVGVTSGGIEAKQRNAVCLINAFSILLET